MKYLALYRQWRPQVFAEVVGQKNLIKGLTNAVKEGRLTHAYLFSGPRGTGKTSVAKILAKAVNCPNQLEGEPCNSCSSCEDINNGSFMDVMEIDAASNRGIDEIRDLREKVRIMPAQGKKRVYIIDEVHMLTTEAFNALLKTLEEPPESVIFILATTEPHRIPATVLSRCQRYTFSRLSGNEIKERLKKVAEETGFSISDKALEVVARRANGSLRDALGILDQCVSFRGNDIDITHVLDVLGLVDHETLAGMVEAICKNHIEEIINSLEALIKQGKEPVQIAREMAFCMRDLLMIKVLGTAAESLVLPPETPRQLEAVISQLTVPRLSQAVKHLLKLGEELRFNEGQRFLLEVGFLELAEMLASTGRKAVSVTSSETRLSTVRQEEKGNLARDWNLVLERVKAHKVTTHALLVPAQLVSIKEGTLTLGYRPELKFHREKMEEKTNQAILNSALKEVLGQEFEITLVTLEDKKDLPPTARKAIEVFGKDKVEIID